MKSWEFIIVKVRCRLILENYVSMLDNDPEYENIQGSTGNFAQAQVHPDAPCECGSK